MWIPFIFETAHFALNFFGAVVCFAIFWLYFEGWRARRNNDEWPLLIGYLALAISFIVHATSVEDVLLRQSILEQLNPHLPIILFGGLRLTALVFIIFGLLLDPLPQRPVPVEQPWWTKPLATPRARAVLLGGGVSLSMLVGIKLAIPVLSGVIAWIYWRRATTGLERHLKPIAIGFCILALSGVVGLAELWRQGPTLTLYTVTAPFGPLWILEHVLLGAAIGVLGRWVWQYLLKRFFSQLFLIFTAFTVTIFLVMTLVFTSLLIYDMRQHALQQLATDTRVLTLALGSKQEALLSDAKSFAQRGDITAAVVERRTDVLQEASQDFLLATAESSLAVVTAEGEVLARGEDGSAVGESLSEDPLVRTALAGESAVSVVQIPGVLAPGIVVQAAAPVKHNGSVVGAALIGSILDNAFVDGVKAATGLETAIYSGTTLSATTIVAADGTSRWIGITEDDPAIVKAVVEEDHEYTGSVTLLHAPYFAAYLPLHNHEGSVIGMLFAGVPQLVLWQTVGRSIEVIYLLVALLAAASLIPAFFVARYIAFQVR
jgi:hypothetical protein